MNKARKRAIRSSDNDVGQERYELYKTAFEWISKSIYEGFYLEAISLEESLITDRLESYLTWLREDDFSFMTLGQIQRAINQHETDDALRSLVLDELEQWRRARNRATHEMVKIEDGRKVIWADRIQTNQTIAEIGLELVRKIDRQTKKLRTN